MWNHQKPGLCTETESGMNGSVKLKVYCNGWMHVTNKVLQSVKTAKREKGKQFYSVVSELWPVKKLKSSQAKLATGACKNWIFFAVGHFPPCIPVTACPQNLAPVAGQPEAATFGPCCSCSFYWTRDAFLSSVMVGLTANLRKLFV